jgi:hypothetical protein
MHPWRATLHWPRHPCKRLTAYHSRRRTIRNAQSASGRIKLYGRVEIRILRPFRAKRDPKLDFKEVWATLSIAARPKTSAQLEKVPASAVVNAQPQGIFVRVRQTGKGALCLLFLDNGRVTRSVAQGGPVEINWEQHKHNSPPGNIGTWQTSGTTLTINWGDGDSHGSTNADVRGHHLSSKGLRQTTHDDLR